MPRLTFDEYFSFLTEFDKTFAGKEFRFHGVDYWPVIRMQVLYNVSMLTIGELAYNDTEVKQIGNTLPVKISFKKKLLAATRYQYYRVMAGYRLQRHQQLICSFDSAAHLVSVPYHPGEKVNPFTEGFEKLCKDPQHLYISTENVARNSLEYFIGIFAGYILKNKQRGIQIDTGLQENINAVADFIQKNISTSLNLSDHLLAQILENEAYHFAYIKVLTITKPKIVWSYNYANNRVMAMQRACNTLNISGVEYQHSVQSDLDYAYTDWPTNKINSSTFFPKYFWVWRESDRERIEKNFRQVNPKLQVILGGNIYISGIIRQRKRSANTANKVLVTLQGTWIPEFIEKYISSDDQISWYIRLHPRYPLEQSRLEEFSAKYPQKVETKEANSKSLYELFDMVDYHLTSFSGSALEAQLFDVQNIIYGQMGYDTYKDYIETGAFYFVNDHNSLDEILSKDKKSSHTHDPILADRRIVEENVLNLLQHG
jgi:hypothetical protein